MDQIIDKELEVLKEKTQAARNIADQILINNNNDLRKAVDFLGGVKTALKLVRNKKESITKPMNVALRNARALFAPMEDMLEESEEIVKGRMVSYEEEIARRAQEEKEQIEKELREKAAAQNTIEEVQAEVAKAEVKIQELPKVQKNIDGNNASIQYRTVKTVEVVDREKLPRLYWDVNMVRVRAAALSGTPIPGVEVKEKKVIASY